MFEDVLARVADGAAQSAPWLGPYRAVARRVQACHRTGAALAETLNQALATQPPIRLDAGGLRFVAQQELAPGDAFEVFIARTACVPTRDNPHDLFNALVWLTWPQIKTHLNRLQAAQIARAGVGPQRGALRDALTLFDENAALWRAPNLLVEALRRRDWHALFVTHRTQWQRASLTLVGHALLEKLMQPRKAITAHVWVVADDSNDVLLGTLTPQRLAAKPFLPMPVLGVPGWWPANEEPGFYADPQVFRPPPR